MAGVRQPGYPVPHITAPVVPTAVAPGGPDFTLHVYGANFINGSVVRRGAKYGVPTPVNAALVGCIKGIEKALTYNPPKVSA